MAARAALRWWEDGRPPPSLHKRHWSPFRVTPARKPLASGCGFVSSRGRAGGRRGISRGRGLRGRRAGARRLVLGALGGERRCLALPPVDDSTSCFVLCGLIGVGGSGDLVLGGAQAAQSIAEARVLRLQETGELSSLSGPGVLICEVQAGMEPLFRPLCRLKHAPEAPSSTPGASRAPVAAANFGSRASRFASAGRVEGVVSVAAEGRHLCVAR